MDSECFFPGSHSYSMEPGSNSFSTQAEEASIRFIYFLNTDNNKMILESSSQANCVTDDEANGIICDFSGVTIELGRAFRFCI